MRPFADRGDAGRRLGERLLSLPGIGGPPPPVVIGLARGGVVVAAEAARRLSAPLDVLVVRKLGCPWHPELGVGALAEGGVEFIDDDLLAELRLGPDDLDGVRRREREELERRVIRYRGEREPVPVEGRVAILVDDGLATGGTARAAIAAIRARGPSRLVLAVPIAAAETAERSRALVDDLVVLMEPRWMMAVGEAYLDFAQTSDDEVVALLEGAPVEGRAAASQRTA